MTTVAFGSYDFKVEERDKKKFIFDIARKKWVILTPEEWVRQHILHYLIYDKKYPASLIAVERGIELNGTQKRFDLVVFSYALSMFNPGWEAALLTASQDLSPGGAIAIVDFHDSPSKRFKRWMGFNHVRLDSHLLPCLRDLFPSGEWSVPSAFGGLWSYFLFVGRSRY